MNVSQRTPQTNENLLLIREITRQLCHPVEGLPKNLDPPPTTLGEWKQCLNCLYGWVNVGIQKNVANLFNSLKIGEVIPSNFPSMDIYKNGFATSEICKLLHIVSSNKTHCAIINYYSFLKMVNILMDSRDKEWCLNFNSSLKDTFTNLNPDSFWLNISVSSAIAEYLRLNEIGEVVVKEGSLGENTTLESYNRNALPTTWSKDELNNNEENTEDDMESNIDESHFIMDDTNDEESNDSEENIEDTNHTRVETPYRLVMNNNTLLSLLTYACQINGNIQNDVNIFQFMGGEDDDFTNLFGKLEI